MPDQVNKEYVLNIISGIDFPGNSDLTRMIEHIDVTEKSVKIIVNSELTNQTETITDRWRFFIEKDKKIETCSVIYTNHIVTNSKKELPSKNDQFSNKFDLSILALSTTISSTSTPKT